MAIKRLFLVLTLVSVGLFPQGCVMWIEHDVVSTPKLSEAVTEQNLPYDALDDPMYGGSFKMLRLDLSGPKLEIRSVSSLTAVMSFGVVLPVIPWPPGIIDLFSSHSSPGQIPPPLWIGLDFYNFKGEYVSFDPSRIAVETSNGEIVNAAAIKHTKSSCFPSWLGQVSANVIGASVQVEGPISVSEPSCFWLMFDTSPFPNNGFVLLIGDLQKGRQAFFIPPIHFQTRTAWVPAALGD